MVYTRTVTYPSTNRARRRATKLIKTNALPPSQAATNIGNIKKTQLHYLLLFSQQQNDSNFAVSSHYFASGYLLKRFIDLFGYSLFPGCYQKDCLCMFLVLLLCNESIIIIIIALRNIKLTAIKQTSKQLSMLYRSSINS